MKEVELNSKLAYAQDAEGKIDEDKKQYLTFAVNNEEYGIDIMLVREIKAWVRPTRLPNVPEYLLGVVNLRGVIIPIFDLKARFAIGLTNAIDTSVVIFLALEGLTIGILVDAVSDIINVYREDVRPAPNMDGEVRNEFLSGLVGIDSRMVVLLDVQKLFDINNSIVSTLN
jgi:purine-binding chemotaxis protein CheW